MRAQLLRTQTLRVPDDVEELLQFFFKFQAEVTFREAPAFSKGLAVRNAI